MPEAADARTECMITEPLMIDAGATIGAAARAMRAARRGRLCVVVGDRLVGVATWADSTRVLPPLGSISEDLPVADVMTRNPVVIHPAARIEEAARTLYWHGLQALPVVEEDQSLIGLVTSRDIIGVFIRRAGADIGPCRRIGGRGSVWTGPSRLARSLIPCLPEGHRAGLVWQRLRGALHSRPRKSRPNAGTSERPHAPARQTGACGLALRNFLLDSGHTIWACRSAIARDLCS